MASRKKDRPERVNPLAPTPITPSRPAAPRVSVPSAPSVPTVQRRAAARYRSEQIQRDIYAQTVSEYRTETLLAGVPDAIKKPVVPVLTEADVKKQAASLAAADLQKRRSALKKAALKKSRVGMAGVLTDQKPVGLAKQSVEKLRAKICKSRPTPKKGRRSGGGGPKKFIPWC